MLIQPQCTCQPPRCSSRVFMRSMGCTNRPFSLVRQFRVGHKACKLRSPGIRRGRLGASSDDVPGNEPVMQGSNLQETAQLDKLVDLLLECKSQEELFRAVGENILALDQKFWLRVATRVDTASSQSEKDALTSLSRAVMAMVDAMVKKADAQLTDSGEVLGEILKAAADETGNWSLPLGGKEVAALNKALDDNKENVNEALLANAFAWMRKANDDKLDGMVVLLQRLLQIYAARELKTQDTEGADGFINDLLALDPDAWQGAIAEKASSGDITEEAITKAVQMKLEATILLPSGSNAQRVQVEFLSELKDQIKTAFEKPVASD